MAKPRISYFDLDSITDKEMLDKFEIYRTRGTPRPESQAIRAHVPAAFWSFENTWRTVFLEGVTEHAVKELCRVYVSHSVKCEFCGNQRSIQSRQNGLVEEDYKDLLNFESSVRYDDRQKSALRYAEAIVWDLETDDGLWAALNAHYSEPEIVEMGYFVAITMGQQRWLRTLNIDHHQVLAGTSASLRPGSETAEAHETAKQSPDYWAKKNARHARKADAA